RPAANTTAGPNSRDSGPVAGPPNICPSARGSRTIPVSSGPALSPNAVYAVLVPTSASRNGTRMLTLNTAYPPNNDATLVSRTRREVSTCRSINGALVRNSRRTQPRAATRASPNIANTNGAVQPCCGASVNATINAAIAPPRSAAPGVPHGVRVRLPVVGTLSRTRMAPRLSTTTPRPNPQPQFVSGVSTPPGPNPGSPPSPNPPVSTPIPPRTL